LAFKRRYVSDNAQLAFKGRYANAFKLAFKRSVVAGVQEKIRGR
jgi:hypothetical protein